MSIHIQNLSFAYGNHEVLKNFSVELPSDSLISVLGPNGCGKSTLFRCILNLEESYVGNITLNDEDLRKLDIKERSRRISFVPQSHVALYDYRVLDIVLMSSASQLQVLENPKKDQIERAWDALERLGVAHLAHRNVRQISGGERQLVFIARALVQDARTIIMDEPTSALDYGNTIRVLSRIKELTRQGYSIIQSTHQPDQAFLFADYIVAMSKGVVRAFGSPREVITQELIAELYKVDVEVCSLFDDALRICVPRDLVSVPELDRQDRDLNRQHANIWR